MVIGVAGCMAQIRADEIRKRNPHVDFVVGTAQVSNIPSIVEEILQTRRFQKRLDLPERTPPGGDGAAEAAAPGPLPHADLLLPLTVFAARPVLEMRFDRTTDDGTTVSSAFKEWDIHRQGVVVGVDWDLVQ